ncbi:Uncharacterised protein [Mycobacteroides abscessus subsp. abscessus]|nr:Uncharacterised protein [Mycobacteroides abscessus subsp. abscessus]SKO59626.1 Uncharacterised protein [Mycobacteroides abscessus subsp. abscessus]
MAIPRMTDIPNITESRYQASNNAALPEWKDSLIVEWPHQRIELTEHMGHYLRDALDAWLGPTHTN